MGIYDVVHKAGGMSKYAWEDDPRRVLFGLARYKHVAKLFEGEDTVLEIGCGDGYYSRIVKQHVKRLIATDIDTKSIDEARAGCSAAWPIDFMVGDICRDYNFFASIPFGACYCLDVLEHIQPRTAEDRFLLAMKGLAPVAIIGMPSLESQPYASKLSKEGHVNCKSGADFKATLYGYWSQVFMFSMNDEALGIGFLPMAHYLLALCVR